MSPNSPNLDISKIIEDAKQRVNDNREHPISARAVEYAIDSQSPALGDWHILRRGYTFKQSKVALAEAKLDWPNYNLRLVAIVEVT